jgi:ribonuclease HIII
VKLHKSLRRASQARALRYLLTVYLGVEEESEQAKPQATVRIREESFDDLKSHLEKLGFSSAERPTRSSWHAGKGLWLTSIVAERWSSQGKDEGVIAELAEFLGALGGEKVERRRKPVPPLEVSGRRIGTDEVGKGDYFGPLVVAGVYVNDEIEERLKTLGVRDSKRLSDTSIRNLAYELRRLLSQPRRFEEVWINPLRYNILYQKLKNVNRTLGWGHARVIENLLIDGVECETVIADQFGDESYIKRSLMSRGKRVNLIQVPTALQIEMPICDKGQITFEILSGGFAPQAVAARWHCRLGKKG